MKSITLIEAYQDGTLSQREYTKIHGDITAYITTSKDRLLAWYQVDACTLQEIDAAYSKRKDLTGRKAPSKTIETVINNMDRPSSRI